MALGAPQFPSLNEKTGLPQSILQNRGSSYQKGNKTANRCRCCPYGFHIDLDFVSYAEDVVKGNSRSPRTSTIGRKKYSENGRNLTSPLDSLFSDSLENIVSDFEEILDQKKRLDDENRQLLEAGYLSDFTGYRSKPDPSAVPHYKQNRADPLGLENTPRPRPSHSNGARAQIQKQATAYTALGRTLSEMKARQSMEALVENRVSTSRPSSITPFDPSLLTSISRLSTRSEHDLLPPKSPRNESSNLSWRRPATAQSTIEASEEKTTNGNRDLRDFASLRRGRESGLPAAEATGARIRYYSASPKLPRRLTAAPNLEESNFAYSHQNGHTVLSRHQATSTSPREPIQNGHSVQAPKPPQRESRSISVGTGPLPPAKPCSECPQLKTKLKDLIENPPIPPKPKMRESATSTPQIPTTNDACVGAEKFTQINVGIGTEAVKEEKKELANQESQTIPLTRVSIGVDAQPKTHSIDLDTRDLFVEEKPLLAHTSCNTEGDFVPAEPSVPIEEKTFVDGETQFIAISTKETGCGERIEISDRETMTNRVYYRSFPSQTAQVETKETACSPITHLLDLYIEELKAQLATNSCQASPSISTPSTTNAEAQTELEAELLHELSQEPKLYAENAINESWLQEKTLVNTASGPDVQRVEIIDSSTPCKYCQQKENVFTRNVGVGACAITDKVCSQCDGASDEVDENEVPGFSPTVPVELTRAAATKKLLEQTTPFVRGSPISKSCRETRRSKSGDDLEFIEKQHNKNTQKEPSPSPAPTVPSTDVAEALTTKVILKKEVLPPPSKLPEPIPARIPRPKISKYAVPHGEAETPDEIEEAQDRLTPLRSELRTLGRWARNTYDEPTHETIDERKDKHSNSVPKAFILSAIWSSRDSEEEGVESDGSEGTYEIQEELIEEGTPFEISTPLKEAMGSLNDHLQHPGSITDETAEWALKYVQHEWLKTAAKKNSQSAHVEVVLEALKELSQTTLKTVVNMTDQNGNAALHYAVSHSNFSVVSSLLDCGHCELNLANKAGYTPVMLAALSNLDNDVERTVVHRLFQAGNVNARATQHGQTALMLAVSHGKKETTQLLLENGADVNIQDEEGSTALMCAAEHGHRELVKLLLAQPNVDAALADCDASTALTIAVENGHSDIGVLIYAHLNYARSEYA
ncbi:unnamed protein product, partial [Mesorhabditis belari]|uniref:Uncharacterized protein n=1 Tax=Mesorhabditis belari TaxID=2138241 RepID=A0AAF3J3L9_9BILA